MGTNFLLWPSPVSSLLLPDLQSALSSPKVYKLWRNVILTIPCTQFGICFAKGVFCLWHFATKGSEKEHLCNIKALCKTYLLPLDIPLYSCTVCFTWQQPWTKFYGQCLILRGFQDSCYIPHGPQYWLTDRLIPTDPAHIKRECLSIKAILLYDKSYTTYCQHQRWHHDSSFGTLLALLAFKNL
jgi:hypothetical protein